MALRDIDKAGLVFARTRGHSPRLERTVAAYSRAGEHAACWIALGLFGALVCKDRDRRHAWLRGVGVVAGSYGVNQAIKFVVRRRRPDLAGLPPLTPVVTQLSFPSAHATTSFAAARAYRGLAPARLLYLAAGAFAVSRPYLGVHYPSDVVAGAALGTAVAKLSAAAVAGSAGGPP
ncbi:MAG TPA: phosphatase PAP2 family protein [Solirubrobacteraceae bacterium]|nr:phosphatase PAP2 family protein [Solirubrobacteraceae bacterium]